jgi:hypothetical protein
VIWAELLEKLVPVLSGISIALLAPKDFDPEALYIWDDTEANFLDTPETVERILLHNARYRALCES